MIYFCLTPDLWILKVSGRDNNPRLRLVGAEDPLSVSVSGLLNFIRQFFNELKWQTFVTPSYRLTTNSENVWQHTSRAHPITDEKIGQLLKRDKPPPSLLGAFPTQTIRAKFYL